MELHKNGIRNLKERKTALHALIHLKTKNIPEKLASVFYASWLIRKKAIAFSRQYSEVPVTKASVSHRILIQPYTGNNFTALTLRNLTLAQLKDDIDDIIIHGSIGDGTACPYSDFDCLIVINDDVLSSAARLARTAVKLRKWQKLMLHTDLLQHHGWFVALKSDFNCWDQTNLPAEVFIHSKSLLHQEEYELEIFTVAEEDFKTPFLKLYHELMNFTPAAIGNMNCYELKTFMSRFFLMPALYYQARNHKGIYKKDSFTLARNDFSENLWQPVSTLSALRMQWTQHYSSLTNLLIKTFFLWPLNFRKLFYPKAPSDIKSTVVQNLPAIKTLLQVMKKNVD